MDDSSGPLLALTILLVIVLRLLNSLLKAGYFNLGQIALLSLAERAKEQEEHLFRFLEEPHRLGISCQLFDKSSLLILIALGFAIFPEPGMVHALALLGYMIIFDVLIAQTLGAFFPEILVTRLFPVMRIIFLLETPVTLILVKISGMGRRHDQENNDEEDDPEDIRAFIRAGAEEGIIEEKEKTLIENLLTFNDTVVREVMTPRTDMICIEHSCSYEEILKVFKESKFSRLPVYRENIDHIEGVLRFKDLIELMERHKDISEYITATRFVPEQKNISDLLHEMLRDRLQMAVIIDEFGGTAGLITLEDLIEEIIGEIHDEHEAPEADEIISLSNGDTLVDGKVPLEDFCNMFQVEVESEDIDTIGGYIFNNEGHIPNEGASCMVGDLEVEISKADNRRIYQIKVFSDQTGPAMTA